jgi:hypothetical protein
MKGCRGAEGPVGGLSLAWVAPWSVRGLSSVRTPCFSHCEACVRFLFLGRSLRACAQYALSFYELFILCSITRPLPWFGFPINNGSAASHSAWCVRFMSGAIATVPSNALGVDQPSACADQ